MKKLIISTASLLAVTTALSACGKERTLEEYVKTENFTVYTSAVYSASDIISFEAETSAVESKKLSYALNGSSVELTMGEKTVQTLDFYYTPDAGCIVVADFNFDGYDDIFIPYENPQNYGCYYCYLPNEKKFFENSELNYIGKIMTISGDNTLTENQDDDNTKRTVDYQWIQGTLKAVKKTETYKSSNDNKMHTDVYSYGDDGTEYLIEST